MPAIHSERSLNQREDQPTVSPPPEPATEPAAILFALSGNDRHTFLPDLEPGSFAPARVDCVDTSGFQPPAWEELLLHLRPSILVTGWSSPAFPARFIDTDDIPVRYICHTAGTVRHLVPRRLLERGVTVSNWGACVGPQVAEHALLLVLAAMRNLPAWQLVMRATPPERSSGLAAMGTRTLFGKRVGLHGIGAVARALVALLRPFQVEISAFSEGVPEAVFADAGVRRADTLEELFSNSDVLVECEALNERTYHQVSRPVLRLLPRGAIFVNVGRGAVVDEPALLELASEGHLRVGLDVFAHEPLPPDSPWFDLPNAVCSPHIAGPTHDMYRNVGQHALTNIHRFLAGQPVNGQVTLESYDRST